MLTGALAGVAASAFLLPLDIVTSVRVTHPWLRYGLPLAGLAVGFLYHAYGKRVAAGHLLIFEEIQRPQTVLPARMAPLVFIGTVFTHLCGGSAGREGAAVQVSAALADQLSRPFRLTPRERTVLLMMGSGAGFGAAVGAPWAGVLFGMEVVAGGRFRLQVLPQCLLASLIAFLTTRFLSAPHIEMGFITVPPFSMALLFSVLVAGVSFGLAARGFAAFTHLIERLLARSFIRDLWKPFVGGCVLVLLFKWEGTLRYCGLGLNIIQRALERPVGFRDPLLKAFFTSLTVGSGFKGGEFIPLVFVGTTLGSALSSVLPAAVGILGALGFAAVFAGAANTPFACTVMAMELFGWRIGPYALLACALSFLVSGRHGIYRGQPLPRKKWDPLTSVFPTKL